MVNKVEYIAFVLVNTG